MPIKLDDELDAEIRAAAAKEEGTISAWIAEAARQRLVREMWQKYADAALGPGQTSGHGPGTCAQSSSW